MTGWAEVGRGRPCTVCRGRGLRVAATHVAGAADGLEWFECGQHGPTENVAGVERVRLTPIAEWFVRNGLPVPDAPSTRELVARGVQRLTEAGLLVPEAVERISATVEAISADELDSDLVEILAAALERERGPALAQDGESTDFYQFEDGGRVEIASADPAATARWLREIEIESDRDDLLPHFTD